MSSEQSRKVLEDIQRAKNKLLKDGAAATLGLPLGGGPPPHLPSSSSSSPSSSTFSSNDVHMSPLQRSAMQVLQQANLTSFAYFVPQDSHFGNSILPVLPRIDNPNNNITSTSTSTTPSTSATASPIKTEK